MASESDRITKNKRIDLPTGGDVLFPIIARISFTDASDRYQETQHTIDNTENSDRESHVAWVGGSQHTETAPAAEIPDDSLGVERIDIWRALDKSDRAQETFTTIDNKTKDEDGPPYFTNHLKTHVLRIVNDPDDGNWIETEVIDQFSFVDASDRNQETIYNLNNPPGEDDGNGHLIFRANPDDEEIDGGETIDPPWRIDPFQNIVKISEQIVGIVWTFYPVEKQVNDGAADCGTVGTANFSFPPDGVLHCGWTTQITIPLFPGSPILDGFVFTGPYSATVSSPVVFADRTVSWAPPFTPWLKPRSLGGTVVAFNGTTNVSGSIPIYSRQMFGDGTGFYGTGDSGIKADGYEMPPFGPGDVVPVGTCSASLSATTGTYLGSPYECYATNIAFIPTDPPTTAFGSVTMTAWFKPAPST